MQALSPMAEASPAVPAVVPRSAAAHDVAAGMAMAHDMGGDMDVSSDAGVDGCRDTGGDMDVSGDAGVDGCHDTGGDMDVSIDAGVDGVEGGTGCASDRIIVGDADSADVEGDGPVASGPLSAVVSLSETTPSATAIVHGDRRGRGTAGVVADGDPLIGKLSQCCAHCAAASSRRSPLTSSWCLCACRPTQELPSI